MGCGISKARLQKCRSLPTHTESICESRRSELVKDESVFNHRKSVSSVASEGGFLKKVIGSNEKERGMERELEPSDRKSISSSFKEHNLCHEKHRDETAFEEGEEELARASNVVEYSSILLFPGSPSFRVYCVDDDYIHVDSANQDEVEEAIKDSRQSNDGDKEMKSGMDSRGRGRGFRNAMFRTSRIGLRAASLRRKTLLRKCNPTSNPS